MNTRDPRATLLALALERGASLSQLSLLIGRNTSYLHQFVRKRSPRKLEEGDRQTLARFFGIDETRLAGDGGMVPEKEKSFTTLPVRARALPDWVDVPRLAIDASAGPGALSSGEQMFGALRFGAAWLRGQGLDPTMLTAIAVAGDSMEPTLRDGDEILVDQSPRAPRDGVYVVRVGDGLLVKRLDLARPGRIVLISDNTAYHPVDLPREEVAIIGRVVWKGGRL